MVEPGAGLQPGRIALALTGGALASVLAIYGAANSLQLAGTGRSADFLPETPGGETLLLKAAFESTQDLDAAGMERLRSIARMEPINGDIFAYAGYAALKAGKIDEAEKLLIEARNRRPRSRLARFALLEIYGRRSDLDSMVGELIPLVRLEPDLAEPLAEQWVKAVRGPKDIETLGRVLADEPALYGRLAAATTKVKTAPRIIISLVEFVPKGDAQIVRQVTESALEALVQAGEFQLARKVWLTSAKPEADDRNRVFNASLEKVAASPPFNWELHSTTNGSTDWQRNGGIFVDYFGRGSEVFAEQLLLLQPGSYRLSVMQRVDDPAERGLSWRIECSGGDRVLLTSKIAAQSGNDASTSASFTVSGDCPAQWLRLAGRGADRSSDGQRISVSKIEIVRAQGGGEQ